MKNVALGSLISDARAGFACGEDVDEGIIQIRMHNVTTSGDFDWSKIRKVPFNKCKQEFMAAPGDIFVNHTNSPDLVGKNAVFNGHHEAVTFSNHFFRLRINHKIAESSFISKLLTSYWGQGVFKSMCRQWVNQASLSKEQIFDLQVPLYSLSDQRRIIKILNHVDELRRKRLHTMHLIDMLANGLYYNGFGDPVNNTKNLKTSAIGDLNVEMAYGPRFYNENYSENGTRIIRITDLSDNGELNFNAMPKLQLSNSDFLRHRTHPGELIFARTGATVGKIALISENDPVSVPGAYFIRLRFPENIDPVFAHFTLKSQSIQKIIKERSRQSAQQNFSGPGLRKLPFIVPDLNDQREFASRILELRKIKSHYRAHLARIDILFSSLQHRAFRGEL